MRRSEGGELPRESSLLTRPYPDGGMRNAPGAFAFIDFVACLLRLGHVA